MNPTQAIHGTPITPRHLLAQMQGASFCVSYYSPQQLEDVIPLLGPDSVLLLDNGAFSAWRKGLTLDESYWDGYWTWAKAILDRVPQAVAVVPDVIGGTVEENIRHFHECPEIMWGYQDRLMMVWHLNEPLSYLRWMLESGFGNIAFGSAGEFSTVGTPAWDARIDEAFALIDSLTLDLSHGIARPRIHMMRGLGQLKRGRHPFTTADSTNIARNHCRTKGQENHVAIFRARIEGDSFPAAPCALWPQASWETPRDMTMAEITADLDECKASLARTLAELVEPDPEPSAPAPATLPAQFELALPVYLFTVSPAATLGRNAHHDRNDDAGSSTGNRTGKRGGKGRSAKAGGRRLPGVARSSRMDSGKGGLDFGLFHGCGSAVGIWPEGDTRPGEGASPIHRPPWAD